MKKCEVTLTRSVEKELRKLPVSIVKALRLWVAEVLRYGIYETRKFKGYHDEPLHGARRGQRSVRLNRAYRAIYILTETGAVELIEVIEVNKHKY